MSLYIGLTGYMGSGKGELIKMLAKSGYAPLSLSDMVRAEATKRKLAHTRGNLQDVGNDLRSKHGPGVLGKMICETIERETARPFAVKARNGPAHRSSERNEERSGPAHRSSEQGEERRWVIDGIRNPGEADELRKLSGFRLIGITAPTDTIITRLQKRKREGAALTKKQIVERLEREKGVGEPPEGQQVKKCLDRVDYLIINDGTLKDLEAKLRHFLRLLSGEDRPSFHEVFMEIAYAWAKRATCLRRKVGSVIAKDKQQLTAGYNGAPRGIPHCAEMGGCLREKLKIPSGQRHEICRGTHAEQNAITQAAKFGINIEGGTLYCNCFPCVICTKMILNAGITTVVYDSDYDDALSKEILGQQKLLKLVRYEGWKYGA